MIRGGSGRRTPGPRRGTFYVLVLGITVLIVTIGLAGHAANRLLVRTVALEQDWHDAALLAQSATEHALTRIHDDQWWRETLAGFESTYAPEVEVGRGTIAWRLDDLSDDDLSNDDAHAIRIHGRGRVGESTRVLSVVAWPSGQPLDVLRTAVHADGELQVSSALDVRFGPASSNEQIDVGSGFILGDAESPLVDAPANVTGTVTQPAPAKTMPATALWTVYKSMATEIKHSDVVNLTGGSIQGVVLSPASNPFKVAEIDANGLYLVKVPPATTLQIEACRIEGTLLVELTNSGSKLTVRPEVVWNPARPDFPALLVYTKSDVGTNVTIECSGVLDESLAGFNANPGHTPYYGEADATLDDTYPADLRGVIHVIRDTPSAPGSPTTIIAPRRITGCIIADGDVKVDDGAIVAADPWLLSYPPLGYTRSPPPDTLLVNGDMEAGLSGWSPVGASTTLASSGDAHGGAKRIDVENRVSAADGIRQDVTGQVTSGETYLANVWLRMANAPEDVEIALEIEPTSGGTQRFDVVVPAVGTSWTLATVQHAPTWTGALLAARWVVTTTTTNQDIAIDDASLEPLSLDRPSRLQVVAGTWRAEAVNP